jgi:hypothetical protein
VVARLLAPVGERDRAALLVYVVGQRAPDAAVRADRVDRLELLARPDRHVADRLVDDRAGRARRHAFAARHARGLAHRVVQVERDPRRVPLAGAADHVVALDVVARSHAAVAQDARVVVDRDHRVGVVLTAAAPVREVVALDAVAPHQHEQLVVGGGRLLRVLADRRLVDEQQLGEHRALELDALRRRLDLHPVLAGTHARGREHARADVDHAHAADPDGVVALVVAEHGDLDARVLRGVVDGRPLVDGHLATVDGEGHRPGFSRRVAGDRHDRSPYLSCTPVDGHLAAVRASP